MLLLSAALAVAMVAAMGVSGFADTYPETNQGTEIAEIIVGETDIPEGYNFVGTETVSLGDGLTGVISSYETEAKPASNINTRAYDTFQKSFQRDIQVSAYGVYKCTVRVRGDVVYSPYGRSVDIIYPAANVIDSVGESATVRHSSTQGNGTSEATAYFMVTWGYSTGSVYVSSDYNGSISSGRA